MKVNHILLHLKLMNCKLHLMVKMPSNIKTIVKHPDESAATGSRIMTMVLLIQNRPEIYYASTKRDKIYHRYLLMRETEDG